MGNKERMSYAKVRVAYDIETTNYRDGDVKKTVVYSHAFCVDGVVSRYRTWEEADAFFRKLISENAGNTVVVFVHNLPFEFQFLKNRFRWTDVFAIADRHKVVRARAEGIEFRCTLALTNKSLAAVGKEVGIPKLKGDLDYGLIRHPETPLSQEEINYIDNDVLIIDELIRQRLQNDTIANLPMTKTGYVRRRVRSAVRKDCEAADLIADLHMTTEDYLMARRVFSGGYTHANVSKLSSVQLIFLLL